MTVADLVHAASLFVEASTFVFQTIATPLVDAAAGISQSTRIRFTEPYYRNLVG